jgi:hypothetical protein
VFSAASGSRCRTLFCFAEFLLFALIAVMLWLERAISAHADVISLLFVQLRQLHTNKATAPSLALSRRLLKTFTKVSSCLLYFKLCSNTIF